jgi:hypothetical protein
MIDFDNRFHAAFDDVSGVVKDCKQWLAGEGVVHTGADLLTMASMVLMRDQIVTQQNAQAQIYPPTHVHGEDLDARLEVSLKRWDELAVRTAALEAELKQLREEG